MATIFKDGFDRYGTIANLSVRGWSIANQGAGSWTYQAAGGVNGGGAINCAQDDQPALIPIREATDTKTYARVAFWFKSGGNPGSIDALAEFRGPSVSGGVCGAMFSVTTAGEIQAHKVYNTQGTTNGNVVGASTGATLHDGAYHFIEVNFVAGTSGIITVKVDHASQINYAGDTGQNTSTVFDPTNWESLALYGMDTDGTFDDLHIWDDDAGDGLTGALATPIVIDSISVDAAGSSTQFTPNTGANYQAVDDPAANDGDTTYVSSNTVGHKDLYGFAALAVSPKTIYEVTLNLAVRTEAGAATQYKAKVDSGATEDDGPTRTIVNVGYIMQQSHWTVDPNTAAAWVEANLNAAEFGMEMVA